MPIDGIGTGPSSLMLDGTYKGTSAVHQQGTTAGDSAALVVAIGQGTQIGASFDSKENANSGIRLIAWNINLANKTMGNINDLISKMKGNLTAIVKMYPPYPPGSQDRARILKSYAGIRKEIEELTIPPDYQFAQRILSDPSKVAGAGDQNVTIGQNGPNVTVRGQSVDPGPRGLNIPDLSENATDQQVSAALTSLDSAQNALNQKSEGLASDAYSVARTIEFAAKSTQINVNYGGQPLSADITEISIGFKSSEVSQAISSKTAGALTGNNNQALKVLL